MPPYTVFETRHLHAVWDRGRNRNRERIRRIQKWLLGDQVQQTAGPHEGSVPGWLTEDGKPEFLYPEITGYYLTWLAFLSAGDGVSSGIERRASAAISWLTRQFTGHSVPDTRIYPAGNKISDWRNSGIFAFDLAMTARGLVEARDICGDIGGNTLLNRLSDLLLLFCPPGRAMESFIVRAGHGGEILPQSWSALPGPHQAKTAAAVLLAARGTALPLRLREAASRRYKECRDYEHPVPPGSELHPMFYWIEGLILAAVHGLDPDAWDTAASVFRKLVKSEGPALNPYQPRLMRSDVLAQALRIGCVLKGEGKLRGLEWDSFLLRMAASLSDFVDEDGTVRFSTDPSSRQLNVWSAIFAHQALCFFEIVADGRRLETDWIRLLV